jgi:hypothetical protein
MGRRRIRRRGAAAIDRNLDAACYVIAACPSFAFRRGRAERRAARPDRVRRVRRPAWSAPTPLPGTGNGPAAATARGHVAAFTTKNRNVAPNTASQLLRLDPPSGAVLSTTPVDLAGTAIAAYASDSIAVAGTSIGPSGTVDDRSRVRAGTARAASGAPVLRTLSGAQGQNVTALAGNARGDVALSTRGLRTRLIYLRRAGTSTFSRVLTINVSSTARGVTVAVSPSGELLVVWEDRHEVFARHCGARGTWGAVHTLGPGIQSDLQAAMDATGRMLVAWKSQRVNEGESNSPAVVSFITAAPGHGFGSRRTIETVGQTGTGRFVASPGVRLQVTTRDRALLAWTGFDGAHFVARAMPLDRGHLGPRQQLSPTRVDAVLGDIATANDGRALALWRSGVAGGDPAPGQQPHVFGNVRAAAATTFTGPEAISDDTGTVLAQPTAIIDPQTRRPIALFTDFGTTQPLVSVRPPPVP